MSFGSTHECEALLDDCNGDVPGLRRALGEGYSVFYSSGDDYGYGHHSYDTIYRTADGRFVHAECGGCSCGGSGSWSEIASLEEALQLIPESKRPAAALAAEPAP